VQACLIAVLIWRLPAVWRCKWLQHPGQRWAWVSARDHMVGTLKPQSSANCPLYCSPLAKWVAWTKSV